MQPATQAPLRLSTSTRQTLAILAEAGRAVTVDHIAARRRPVLRETIISQIVKLKKAGFVEQAGTAPHETDQRRVFSPIYKLTDAGLEANRSPMPGRAVKS